MKSLLKNMGVKQKLLLTFTLLIFFLLAVGGIGILNISSINDRTTKIGEVILPATDLLLQIDRDLQQALVAERTMIFSDVSSLQFQDLKKDFDENIGQAKERWTKFKDLGHEGITEEMITKFDTELDAWLQVSAAIYNAIITDTTSTHTSAVALSLGGGAKAFETARENINQFTEITEKVAVTEVAAAEDEYTSAYWLMSLGTLLIILISVFSGTKISTGIGNALHSASLMIAEMQKGKLKTRLKVRNNDEIGKMSASLNSLADTLQNFSQTLYTVADGEVNVKVEIRDKEDELAPALHKIVTTLQDLVKETNQLTAKALEGNLQHKGNAAKFKGGYRELVEGMNATLDAFVKPVVEGLQAMQVLATGDLTVRINTEYKGDLQGIKNAVNALGESLSRLVAEVSEAVHATASASAQISSSTEEMAAGAHEQSSQTGEVASAVEEMSKTIFETTNNASKAADHAKNAGSTAHEGGLVVEQTIEGINRIAGVVIEASETVKKLGQSSDQIGEIIQVIDDIADQTNLLALNAAIEAARAGEMGRGFAVVADEVRKLAERTTKATKEIALMIKQIQSDTSEAVDSMSKGTIEVERGKELAGKAGESLREIINASAKVVDDVTQVATASEEQSAAAEQISKNIEAISSVTSESASGIQQVARAAEDLTRLTQKLQALLGRFKISESEKRLSITSNGKLLHG